MSEGGRVRRRDVLRVAAATGLLGGAAVGVASGATSERHVVGTSTQQTREKAKRMADSVHRDLDFGAIGAAVAGRFPAQAREALQKNPNVRYVEPDGQLQAIGQSLPWGVDRTDAELTTDDGATGAGADVAILDSGIDSDHPDLKANLGAGKAFAYCSGCAEPWDDDNDHGTHCAGIVGAVDNGRAVVGIAPETTLHAVKVLQSNGWGSYSDIAAGVTHVADEGWDVASLSLGGDYSNTLADAIEYAHRNGVLLVAAAGNNGPCSDCVMFPASHPDTVAVSASTSDDSLASFSSTGPEVDLVAPGQGVASTVRGGTAIYSGTSMACPHVSAAGGLLMTQGLSNTEARRQLEASAEDIGLAANEQGNGLLDVEAAVDGTVTDEAPTASVVAPTDGATVSGTTAVQVDARDAEDDPSTLAVEVSVDGGSWQVASWIGTDGVHEYEWDTTSVVDGDHTIEAHVTDSAGNTTSTSVTVTVDNVVSLDLSTVDTTAAGDASFSGSGGAYTLEGSGVDIWTDHDDYAAAYENDVSGDIVASVTVERQENTHPWAKAGLMIANDITAPGSSAGDLILAVTPENGYALQWDSDGDGYVDTSQHTGATSYPAELRVTKAGTEFTGEYSTDGGSTWTTVGTVTIPAAASTQDVGVFLRGSKTDVRGTAEFGNFSVGTPESSLDRPTVDTTAAGDASFLAGTTSTSGDGNDYTLEGSGVDIWTDHDDYAAVFEPDVSGDVVASVTVERQENTHPWAKAGLMIANDITAPGSSAGDLILATTPGNGYALQWDSDGDGYIDTSQHTGATSYPAELRVTKAGTEFTGEYSTDGGSTWTTVGTVTIPAAVSTQDVGVFLRGSDTDVRGTAEFVDFTISSSEPALPQIDTTQAGDASFSGSGGAYTLEGSGVDIWTDHDDYAAVYEPDVSGDVVAEVTVERQANTHPWAKAGLMIANDITAPGSSAGDLILATTPGNGYALQWDSDGDGYVDTSQHGGSTTYPARLRLTKSGTAFTGEYSTDGGSTWTTVGTVTVPDATSTQDVGVFLRGSKTDIRGTAEFSGFETA
jgi:subtilisin